MPRTCKLMSNHKCQYLANCCQLTIARTLPTVADSQKPIPCKLLPIHKCKYLANCCQFTSANTFQTVANSPVPIPCNPLPICKCKYLANFPNSQVPIPCKLLPVRQCQNLANCCQFTIANPELAHCFNAQVPRLCKLITHTCPTKACKQLQFTRANTLQPVATSQVQNQACKNLQGLAHCFNSQVPVPVSQCQNLANCCQFTIANPELARCFNSQVPRLCKLITTHKCPPKACKQLQFTNANTLQPVATSLV